jgi:hypothetical protein
MDYLNQCPVRLLDIAKIMVCCLILLIAAGCGDSYGDGSTDSTECTVIYESNTVTGTTEPMGPDEGKVTIWFDSTFSRPPILHVTVALRMDNSGMTKGSILHSKTEVFIDHCKVKVYTMKDASVMNGAEVDISYMALQIGP